MPDRSQRKYRRKKVDFPVRVTRIERGEAASSKTSGYSFMGVEISAGGMGLVTDIALHVGDLLSVHFQFPGETRSLTLLARVRSVAPHPSVGPAARPSIRAGLSFEGLSVSDATYLANYVNTTFSIY